MHTENILAIDGFPGTDEYQTVLFICEAKDGIDIKQAFKDAALDYVRTPEGRHTYCNVNCHNFNWFDADTCLPEDICLKHGFRIINTIGVSADSTVDANEQLVCDADACPED